MIEKVGHIKNPLTIIAIFAAIAEISGTVVLPFIVPANQATYVWFLMIFPILLIIMFFVTLNFNHKVLYAPSDYQNEDNFLRSLPRATFAEKVLKIEAEISEEDSASQRATGQEKATPKANESVVVNGENQSSPYMSFLDRNSYPGYTMMLAEELVFRKLSKEFSSEIQREVKVGTPRNGYIFDGIVGEKGVTTVIEVKFLRHAMLSNVVLRDALRRVQEGAKLLPSDQTANLRVLLALATSDGNGSHERVTEQIDRYRTEFSFPIEVRFFNLTELQKELKLGSR